MNLLNSALDCVRRGWYVFPCVPRTKQPLGGLVPNGHKDASNDESQVRKWWAVKPDANVGIACGPSNLRVLDTDHGAHTPEEFQAWFMKQRLPRSYMVRTGRRLNKEDHTTTEYGVQVYYNGAGETVIGWEHDSFSGDVKSGGGYVLAAGSIHPDSGEAYEVLDDAAVSPAPEFVRSLRSKRKERPLDPLAPIVEWRNDTLYRVLCKHRANGADDEMLRDFALRAVTRMPDPLDDEEVERIIANACKQPIGQPEAEIIFGSKKEPEPVTDWREHYHTREEAEQAPPVTFLIDGFLPHEAIAAIAAPVAQRKSLIALNVAHALCTGEALFGHFKVLDTPTRVLYLCPEMGIRSFTDRLRKIGLMKHVGKNLFFRTMSKPGVLELDELQPEEIDGAVVIIDTAVRYIKGDENSSEHMRQFAASIFRLQTGERKAEAVVLLHHSSKGAKESNDLTLENAMRGSGELGAFLTTCWATRLQNPKEPYKSPSFLSNVKQRDFASMPFEVTSTEDCRMHYVVSEAAVTLKGRATGNRDGLDEAAMTLLRTHPKLSLRDSAVMLKERGIRRGKDWVSKARYELLQENGGTMQ